MSQIRLHEVAKSLGQTSKTLMAELAKEGHEFKTHMAALEEKVMKYLDKKYPDLRSKLSASAAEPKPEKKPRSAKASGKPITSKSKRTKSEVEVPQEVVDPTAVEIVQREEGMQGTVTLEQRVVREGVIRRRRVEPSLIVATPEPVAEEPILELEAEVIPDFEEDSPQEEVVVRSPEVRFIEEAPQPKSPAKIALERLKEMEATAAAAPPAPPAPVKVKTPEPAAPALTPVPAVKAPPRAPAPPVRTGPSMTPSTGRNLSAPSRLRVVDSPAQPPAARSAVQNAATIRRPTPSSIASTSATGPQDATDEATKAKLAAAKKKPGAKSDEGGRVTKKDLMGMMEEVEIHRPVGRRSKKPMPRMARSERRAPTITTPGASKRKIRIHDEVTVSDLADQMGIKGAELVRKLIGMGQMASLSQRLDFDTAALIAGEYKYEVLNVAESAAAVLQSDSGLEDAGAKEHRAPIVTIMGHVDHGKTSLLDYIRRARVAQGEAGGITQHIGAYKITHNGKEIAFLDTPGHAAFTAMRARGASVTDIIILVVAADEGVKPQTLEALAHAKSAEVPIIVAINKVDKPEADPDKVIQELSGKGLVPEAWGGDTIYCKLSAKTGAGVPELLEMILIQSEVLDLKASKDRAAKGIVIESRLDKGKGPVATVMIQTGTLRQGDPLVSGSTFGKVRAMFDDQGKGIKEAGPSTPVEVLGFSDVPAVGEIVSGVSEDAIARKASELAVLAKKKSDSLKNSRMSLEDMYKKMQTGDVSELRVILKGDVQGSVEAIADSLEKILHDKVRISVIYKAVGGITESDIDLAAASGALVFGFNVRPTNQAKALAAHEGVQIKAYEVIYELLDDVKLAMQGLLAPIIKENTLGQAEVREVFNVSKVGPIAGCYVKTGKIQRNAQIRVIRDSVIVYSAKIHSLRRFKDDAKEVAEGFECGIRVENFTDLKPGDILECFDTTEIKQAVG